MRLGECKKAVILIQLMNDAVVDFKQLAKWQFLRQKGELYELDNFSDAISMEYAIQLVQKSHELLLVVAVEQTQEMGRITDFINRCIKLKISTKSVLIGEQPILKKMLKKLSAGAFWQFHETLEAQNWLQTPDNI